MAVELEKHPDYKAAKDQYDGSVIAAKAAGDEAAELRAEISWRDKRDEIRDAINRENQRAAEIATAREEIKKEFPQVPDAVLARLDDPKEMRQVAEEISAAIPKPDQGQRWPRPTGQGQPPRAQRPNVERNESGDRTVDGEYAANLDTEVHKGNRRAVQEVKNLTIDHMWNRMQEAKGARQ